MDPCSVCVAYSTQWMQKKIVIYLSILFWSALRPGKTINTLHSYSGYSLAHFGVKKLKNPDE